MATTERRASGAGGPDRVAVFLATVAAFMAVLALLGWQMRSGPAPHAQPVAVVRRVYETRVIETIVGAAKAGTSSSQSVSSSATSSPAPVVTATSGTPR